MSTKMALQTNAETINRSAGTVKEAAQIVQEAANTLETDLTKSIKPDISELRMDMNGLYNSANIRLKRILWGIWGVAILNSITLAAILLR